MHSAPLDHNNVHDLMNFLFLLIGNFILAPLHFIVREQDRKGEGRGGAINSGTLRWYRTCILSAVPSFNLELTFM